MAESGTHLLHCTEGLGRDADFPPTREMFDAGVDIVLGTDWLTMDPWANMRFGHRPQPPARGGPCHRKRIGDAPPLHHPAGAGAGSGDRIGSLEPNKQADLLLLDLTGPNLTPMFHDPVVTIVYNACRGDVTDVMVDGRFTVRHRRLPDDGCR